MNKPVGLLGVEAVSTELERYLYYPEMAPRRPIGTDVLKLIAVVFVAISLVGVYFAATSAPAPLFRIRDLQGNFLLNYATVMVEGRIAEPVRLDVQAGGRVRLTLTIVEEDDPTRTTLTIFVYDPVASELLRSWNYADFGDRVRVLVQLRVREDFTYGILQDVRHLVVLERSTDREPLYVTSLQGVEEYTYVCTRGAISSSRNVSAGLLISLLTGTDSITVLVPHTIRYRFSDHLLLSDIWSLLNKPGSVLRICGPVYYYRGVSPEIVVVKLDDVAPVEVVEVELPSIEEHIGEALSVKGIFTRLGYDATNRLYIVTLRSEEGFEVNVTARRSVVVAGIDPWTVGIGSLLRVTGVALDPTTINASHIEPVELKPPYNATRVSDALAQPRGHVVILWNVRVYSSRVTSGGSWIIDVEDETGTIRIFVPSSVAREIGNLPPVGSYIAVAGYRDIYGEIEEIIVYSGNGLVVLREPPPEQPTLVAYTPVRIQDLGNYVGKNVSVTGELVSIRYSSAERLYYVTVRDETGAANFTMGRALVKLINPWYAGPGTLLRINGTARSSTIVETHTLEVVVQRDTPVLTVRDALARPHGVVVAIVNATVTGVRVTSGNDWQINITDPSGAVILVFVPRSVVDEIGRSDPTVAAPTVGTVISVAGYRDVFRGVEEIVVYTAEGMRW